MDRLTIKTRVISCPFFVGKITSVRMKWLLCYVLIVCGGNATAVDWIAHRANGCGAVENSIEAIESAWAIGSDAVEIDIRFSKDGVVYLFHDDEINGNAVADLTYRKIQEFAGRQSVPKLSSVFDLGVPDGYYLLDLKRPTMNDVALLLGIIRQSGVPSSKLVIQSSNPNTVRLSKSQLPKSQYALLHSLERSGPFLSKPTADDLLTAIGQDVDILSIKGRNFLDNDYIKALKLTGLRVFVWTINDAKRVLFYESIGIDGIITDKIPSLADGLRSCKKRGNEGELEG